MKEGLKEIYTTNYLSKNESEEKKIEKTCQNVLFLFQSL